MHITLEPTSAFLVVEPQGGAGGIHARLWVGTLDDGYTVQALILNVAAPGHPDQETLALRLAHEAQRPPQKVVWTDDNTRHLGDPFHDL